MEGSYAGIERFSLAEHLRDFSIFYLWIYPHRACLEREWLNGTRILFIIGKASTRAATLGLFSICFSSLSLSLTLVISSNDPRPLVATCGSFHFGPFQCFTRDLQTRAYSLCFYSFPRVPIGFIQVLVSNKALEHPNHNSLPYTCILVGNLRFALSIFLD